MGLGAGKQCVFWYAKLTQCNYIAFQVMLALTLPLQPCMYGLKLLYLQSYRITFFQSCMHSYIEGLLCLQSFHFSPRLPGKDWASSEAAHEARLAALLKLGPGKKCLDVGCGVGGPMRTIASTSGAEVTGITINGYQVSRAKHHNEKVQAAHRLVLAHMHTSTWCPSEGWRCPCWCPCSSNATAIPEVTSECAAGSARHLQACARQLPGHAIREGDF